MSQSYRIALIDDDLLWMETLAHVLRHRGFEVVMAQGGACGLELLRNGDIGLAVVDFHMPDLDGLELVRHLRRHRLAVDVLLMSSDDDPTLPNRAVAEGASAFLSKSLQASHLLRSLMEIVVRLAHHPTGAQRWDRFLPVPRLGPWLPIPWVERN